MIYVDSLTFDVRFDAYHSDIVSKFGIGFVCGVHGGNRALFGKFQKTALALSDAHFPVDAVDFCHHFVISGFGYRIILQILPFGVGNIQFLLVIQTDGKRQSILLVVQSDRDFAQLFFEREFQHVVQ